ncbi:MAG: CsgG/HfaB family protein [Victivallales bacterium]
MGSLFYFETISISDKGLENYADLLTAELSKQKDLNVIERVEINKILKEQEISSANSPDGYLKLGKLLKADGLVII